MIVIIRKIRVTSQLIYTSIKFKRQKKLDTLTYIMLQWHYIQQIDNALHYLVPDKNYCYYNGGWNIKFVVLH